MTRILEPNPPSELSEVTYHMVSELIERLVKKDVLTYKEAIDIVTIATKMMKK